MYNKYSIKNINIVKNIKLTYSVNFPKIDLCIQEIKPKIVINKRLLKINNTDTPLFYELVPSTIINKEQWYNIHNRELEFDIKKIKEKFSDEYNSLIDLLYFNPFISGDIQYQIESSNYQYTKYEKDNIIIENYQLDERCNININNIFKITNMMRTLMGNPSDKVHVIFALSNRRKMANLIDDHLVTKNVNSACCLPRTYVKIWRFEECIKVLIHELVHFFQKDHQMIDYGEQKKKIAREFGLFNFPKIYEGFTETLALIIYHQFYGKILNKDYNNELSKEYIHSLIQWNKIVSLFPDGVIREKANVTAYYYVKALLFSNYEILSYFINNQLVFNPSHDQLKKLFDDKVLKEHLHTIKLTYNKIKNILSDYQKKNLRMSLIEYEMKSKD